MINFPTTKSKNSDYIITPSENSSKKDFDFLIGSWNIHNRKLKSRFTNSTEWIEFEATGTMHTTLQGMANVDDFLTTFDGKSFEGMTVRIFNPSTKLWKLYWADSNTGVLDTPVTGSFDKTTGRFYGTTLIDGKEILVVFNWDRSDADKPVWSQAFSADGGKTWEWNWYMEFTRKK